MLYDIVRGVPSGDSDEFQVDHYRSGHCELSDNLHVREDNRVALVSLVERHPGGKEGEGVQRAVEEVAVEGGRGGLGRHREGGQRAECG